MITKNQIAAARALLEWNQEELSQASGVSKDMISKIEAGKSAGSLKTVQAIQNALDQSGIEFFDNQGVAKKSGGFKVYRGRIGFMDFLEDVYDTIKNGGEVFCSNVDESQFLKFERDDAHVHMDRMASVPGLKCRFLIKEGDMNVISSHYAVYKHSQPEDFGALPIYIFGDKTGFILFSEDDVNVYVIEDPFISRFFRMEFLKLWKRAKDIPL